MPNRMLVCRDVIVFHPIRLVIQYLWNTCDSAKGWRNGRALGGTTY